MKYEYLFDRKRHLRYLGVTTLAGFVLGLVALFFGVEYAIVEILVVLYIVINYSVMMCRTRREFDASAKSDD